MANHCIELVCAICGTRYCARGCDSQLPPDQDLAAIVSGDPGKHQIDDRCPFCGQNEVYIFQPKFKNNDNQRRN